MLLASSCICYTRVRSAVCKISLATTDLGRTNDLRNHPFIVYTSTRHLKGQVPRSYLQNSYKICTINAHWVVMLLKDMDRSRVSMYDPFLGYLVTIAATIHLDKSLRKNGERANAASQDFQFCYDFVRKMASIRPSLKNVVRMIRQNKWRAYH